MIENFSKADEDYGRRVAEGLKNVAMNNGSVSAPSGASKTEEAVKQAEEMGKEAQSY